MSQIEWTDKTWNAVVGCSRITAGCDLCYATWESHRKHTNPKMPQYHGLTAYDRAAKRVEWTGKLNRAPRHKFYEPLGVKTPTVWFVNSMSDCFHEAMDDADLVAMFEIMNRCSQHTFQVLTKRPSRMAKKTKELGLNWTPNIWAGASIEEDRYAKPRVRELLKVPSKLRFVSAEPLLSALPSLEVEKIDWLIVGGESAKAWEQPRRMEPAWAVDLWMRCRAAGTPYFFKQWGDYGEDGVRRSKRENGHLLQGEEIFEMPADAYDRLKAHGKKPDPRWVSIPKRAFGNPSMRLQASAHEYVIDGVATDDLIEFMTAHVAEEGDTYTNPQRTERLMSEAEKRAREQEAEAVAQWEALLGR